MQKFFLTFFLLSLIQGFAKEGESSGKLLISDLKGIILMGPEVSMDQVAACQLTEEIEGVGLDEPRNFHQLKSALEPFVHHPLTRETLTSIHQTVADFYAENARPFVAIAVPNQEVTSGVLHLTVVESRVGEIIVEGNQWTREALLKSYIQNKPGEIVNQSELLQNISFINRNPFRRTDLVLVPGKEQGTTDVIVATLDRFPVRPYAGVDNAGLQPTGQNRWYAGINAANIFGLDHTLSYQFTTSFDMRLFKAHTCEYIASLSWGHLLSVYGGYSEVHPKVSQSNLKRNDGWSLQGSARYLVPLRISQYLEHAVSGGFDFKRCNNTFEFTEQLPRFGSNVNLTQFVVAYLGNYERKILRFDFNSQFFWSPGRWLPDQSNADYSSLRTGAVNQWVYFNGSLTYLQRLPKVFSVQVNVTGQAASHPLLPSEQLGIGGYNTVRGYEEREITVDDGLIGNLEVRGPPIPIVGAFRRLKRNEGCQLLFFTDYGWGINIKTITGTPKADYLLGMGPGLRYTFEPYLTARADWGFRLHNSTALPGATNKIHVSLTGGF